ncbi:MAG: hypothetical protein V3T61_05925 [Acidobacteriota bacterium]
MPSNGLPLFILRTLSAEFLIFGTLYLSYSLSYRLLGRASVVRRWCATVLIAMWLMSAIFHLLLPLGQFRLSAVLFLLGLLVFATRLTNHPYSLFLHRLWRDLSWFARVWRLNRASRYRWLIYLFALFALVKCIRAALLPPLGWDTLTYHAVKAAMWIQTGGPAAMEAPGGWSSYRTYVGGGEIFTAWAMLPFHNDLLVGLVDPLQWLFLGLVLYGLARQLGLKSKYAWIGTVYVLCLPAAHLSVGAGYVDLGNSLALLASLMFAIRFLRHRDEPSALLAVIGLGVASGIKVTAWPVAAVVLPIMGWSMVRNRQFSTGKWILAGGLAALAVLVPWLAYNVQWTGYPLSPMPVSIGSLPLGVSTPALRWYQDLLSLEPYTWEPETMALSWLLRSPTKHSLHLREMTHLQVALFLAILPSYLFRKTAIAILSLGFIGAFILFYYSPGFSVVRIYFAQYNGRFLFPIASVVVLLSLSWCRHKSLTSELYLLYLGLATALHIAGGVFYGWAAFERLTVPLALVLLLVFIFSLSGLPGRWTHPQLLAGTAVLVPLLLLPVLAFYKDNTRYRAAGHSDLMHPTVKYWAAAAELVDEPETPKRIAVTAGPWQKADNWAMYFFMGRNLQNRVFYTPVSRSGEIIDFGPEGTREQHAQFDSWAGRLLQQRMTHVMCFHPPSIEMLWMEYRPDLFERVAGVTGFWGLYRIRGQSL